MGGLRLAHFAVIVEFDTENHPWAAFVAWGCVQKRRVGDDRIRLRANKGAQGRGRVGAQAASVLPLSPVDPFIKGKAVTINKGTMVTAYSDQDVVLATPLAAPPTSLN